MRVLILSCNTGEGHNTAGKALRESLQLAGHQAELVDIMSLAGPRVSKAVGGAYIEVAKHLPGVFGFFYRLAGKISSPSWRSPVYYANSLMAGHLADYLKEHPADIIVAPHLYPAETLTYMKRRGMKIPPFVAVSTDYTCIPFWEETRCDRYVIPHEDLMEEYQRRGIPKEKLVPLGIPVNRCFSETEMSTSKDHILAAGTPEKKKNPVYLVMSGSMGFGRIQVFVLRLARKCRSDEDIVVICGNNQKLRRRLEFEFGHRKNIRILGYTDHVSEYMEMSDVIFTKPGGLTSTEAAVKGIPIVHTGPIPGCETANMTFFVERGMSVHGEKMDTQIALGQLLVRNDSIREGMLLAQRQNANPEAAAQITKLLEEIAAQRAEEERKKHHRK